MRCSALRRSCGRSLSRAVPSGWTTTRWSRVTGTVSVARWRARQLPPCNSGASVRRRPRVGGILSYHRSAAQVRSDARWDTTPTGTRGQRRIRAAAAVVSEFTLTHNLPRVVGGIAFYHGAAVASASAQNVIFDKAEVSPQLRCEDPLSESRGRRRHPGQSDREGERRDMEIRAALAAAHAPGASVLIARNGVVEHRVDYGFRDIPRRIPVDNRTRFKLGSISKQFTAAAVLQLVERGRLKLDDSIASFLPAPDGWRAITIKHLLAHTSGLWDWEEDPAFAFDRQYSDEEFIDYIARHPMKGEPGARFSYTNSGYPLLGMIVRRVANQSFES